MYSILAFILLFSSIPYGFPLPPSPVEPTVAPVSPAPSPFPLNPTPQPLIPFNNVYNSYGNSLVVPILSYTSEHNLDGNYKFSFATADGKQAEESGYLKYDFVNDAGHPLGTQVVQGSYSYISPDGTPVQVSYIADEKGFRPSVVQIRSNEKTFIPTIDKDNSQGFNPVYNRFNNPYLNRNGLFGQVYNVQTSEPSNRYDPRYLYESRYPYNSRYPYESRYPYDFTKFNNYIPLSIDTQTNVKAEVKKDSI